MCCQCDGSCNHVGPHSLCPAHGGTPTVQVMNVHATTPYICNVCGRIDMGSVQVISTLRAENEALKAERQPMNSISRRRLIELEAQNESNKKIIALVRDYHLKRELFKAALLKAGREHSEVTSILADAAQRLVEDADRALIAAMKERTR